VKRNAPKKLTSASSPKFVPHLNADNYASPAA